MTLLYSLLFGPNSLWKRLPNRIDFINHISSVVRQCRRSTVPLGLDIFSMHIVDSSDETQVPAWQQFITVNNVS